MKDLVEFTGILLLLIGIGIMAAACIASMNDATKVASNGLSINEINKMRTECEAALPRNKKCELVFIPEDSINGPVVEESGTRAD